jgi:hypothetical protein
MKNNETIETNNRTLETHSGTLEASEHLSTRVTLEPSNPGVTLEPSNPGLEVDFPYNFFIPEYAGYYRIGPATGYMACNFETKPNWLHRMFSKLLLGWEWVDNV